MTEAPLTWREEYGVSLHVPLFKKSKAELAGEAVRTITLEELAKHNSESSCWVVVHGRVYDATSFISRHPGGWLPLKALAGKPDATDAFEAYHPARVHSTLLPSMFIGWLETAKPVLTSESKLREEEEQQESKLVESKRAETLAEEAKVDAALRDVRQELLKRNAFFASTSYYLKLYAWFASLFVLAVYFSLDQTYYWLGAVFMGVFWQQVAFVGHDIGHNAVLGSRDNNLFYGVLIGNTLMGISLGWWKQSHNVHHVVCNSVEHDPDIQHMPVFAVNEKLFNKGGFFSTYHKKRFDMDLIARGLVSIQHALFYPVMAVARINLYVQSWVNLLLQPHGRVPYRELEIATLLAFFVWIGALLMNLETPGQRWAWIAISHAVSGLLHVQICLSHFSMDAHREGDEGRASGWFTMQMQTTMNVDTYPWMDFFHGGLQFQVEHHMFPRLPRHRLREARTLVMQVLKEAGALDRYHEMGFIEGNVHLLKTMREAARECGNLRKGDGGFYVSPLYNGLNLEG